LANKKSIPIYEKIIPLVFVIFSLAQAGTIAEQFATLKANRDQEVVAATSMIDEKLHDAFLRLLTQAQLAGDTKTIQEIKAHIEAALARKTAANDRNIPKIIGIEGRWKLDDKGKIEFFDDGTLLIRSGDSSVEGTYSILSDGRLKCRYPSPRVGDNFVATVKIEINGDSMTITDDGRDPQILTRLK
jgi:hypothetical protein